MKKTSKPISQTEKIRTAVRTTNARGRAGVVRRKSVPENLGKKLAAIREFHKKSQSEMLLIANPNEIEENRSRVSQWERGVRIPSLIEVLNYAKFANVTVEMLIDDDLDLEGYENYI